MPLTTTKDVPPVGKHVKQPEPVIQERLENQRRAKEAEIKKINQHLEVSTSWWNLLLELPVVILVFVFVFLKKDVNELTLPAIALEFAQPLLHLLLVAQKTKICGRLLFRFYVYFVFIALYSLLLFADEKISQGVWFGLGWGFFVSYFLGAMVLGCFTHADGSVTCDPFCSWKKAPIMSSLSHQFTGMVVFPLIIAAEKRFSKDRDDLYGSLLSLGFCLGLYMIFDCCRQDQRKSLITDKMYKEIVAYETILCARAQCLVLFLAMRLFGTSLLVYLIISAFYIFSLLFIGYRRWSIRKLIPIQENEASNIA